MSVSRTASGPAVAAFAATASLLLASRAVLPPVAGAARPALGVVLFGGSLPFTRLAMESLDPWFVTAARAAPSVRCCSSRSQEAVVVVRPGRACPAVASISASSRNASPRARSARSSSAAVSVRRMGSANKPAIALASASGSPGATAVARDGVQSAMCPTAEPTTGRPQAARASIR